MRKSSRPELSGGVKVGLLVLAVCTVWLVIQNTVLMLAMLWSDPLAAGKIVIAVAKAVGLVGAKFWTSPAAIAIASALLIALLVRGRESEPAREGVRHGG